MKVNALQKKKSEILNNCKIPLNLDSNDIFVERCRLFSSVLISHIYERKM